MTRPHDPIHIAERALSVAVNRLDMFLDGTMNEHPELLMEAVEELVRLKKAHKVIYNYLNKPVDIVPCLGSITDNNTVVKIVK